MTALADRLREQIAILDERIATAREQGGQPGHLIRRRAEVQAQLEQEEKNESRMVSPADIPNR